MTANELFNEFWRACNKAEGNGCSETRAAALWDEVVAPHLNVPRSLPEDPPYDGQRVIIFETDAHGAILKLRVGFGGLSKGEGFWMPCPNLPEIDMHGIEFKRWLEHQDVLKDASKERIRDIRFGWIARGEVNP